jgi:hypothetical protein
VKPLGFVDALARLLSESDLRNRFAVDRDSVATELGLNESDAKLLLELDLEKLKRQAEGLLSKRRSEVVDFIPSTWKRLQSTAQQKLFDEYASQSSWPESHRRHLLDAVAFCQFLLEKDPTVVVRSEYRWLKFVSESKKLSIALVSDFVSNNQNTHRAIMIMYRWRHTAPRLFVLRCRSLTSIWNSIWQRKSE